MEHRKIESGRWLLCRCKNILLSGEKPVHHFVTVCAPPKWGTLIHFAKVHDTWQPMQNEVLNFHARGFRRLLYKETGDPMDGRCVKLQLKEYKQIK